MIDAKLNMTRLLVLPAVSHVFSTVHFAIQSSPPRSRGKKRGGYIFPSFAKYFAAYASEQFDAGLDSALRYRGEPYAEAIARWIFSLK
jgi:hypothetical protein